jgi:hypothetical protein
MKKGVDKGNDVVYNSSHGDGMKEAVGGTNG